MAYIYWVPEDVASTDAVWDVTIVKIVSIYVLQDVISASTEAVEIRPISPTFGSKSFALHPIGCDGSTSSLMSTSHVIVRRG